MEAELDQQLTRREAKRETIKKNLSKEELEGLEWLECMTDEGKLSVVEADKGGAILIVNPELLRKKTLEKLEDPNLYNKLAEDPTHNLHHELFRKWVEGKEKGLIHPETAKSIMGVSDNDSTRDDKDKTNAKSTSSHHKPGKAYFYPSIKIHKLTKQELVPGVEPPVRLVTALHEGIAKRSDVFLASEYLKHPPRRRAHLLVLVASFFCWRRPR